MMENKSVEYVHFTYNAVNLEVLSVEYHIFEYYIFEIGISNI